MKEFRPARKIELTGLTPDTKYSVEVGGYKFNKHELIHINEMKVIHLKKKIKETKELESISALSLELCKTYLDIIQIRKMRYYETR